MGFDVGAVFARLKLDKKEWDQSIQSVGRDEKSLVDSASKIGKGFTDAGKAMTIAGGAITAAFGLMIKKTADYGDELNDMSKRTGIATDILSGYSLAADQSGTSLDGLATGLKGLSRVMDDANTGGKEAQGTFKMLGISYADNEGKIRPLNDVMLEVADKFAALEDGGQKNALAMKVFGKAGMDLIPMLNLGRDGLMELRGEAERLGIVMSKEDAEACDRFNDSLASLKGAVSGAGKEIGMSLMPAVESFVGRLTEVIAGVRSWAADHPGLTKALSATGLAIGGVLTGMGSFLMIAGTLITKLLAVASALHTTAAALVATTALWSGAALGVGYYVAKLFELKDAIDKADEADKRFVEKNIELSNKLYELVKNGDMAIDTYYKLWDQFEGNAAAMAMFIEKGEAGKVAQEGLVEVGKKHAAAIEEQRKKLGFLILNLDAANKAAKEWEDTLKSLGIESLGNVTAKTTELLGVEEKITKLYQDGKISSTEYAGAIRKLNDDLATLGSTTKIQVLPPSRDLSNALKIMKLGIGELPRVLEDVRFGFGMFEVKLKSIYPSLNNVGERIRAFAYEMMKIPIIMRGSIPNLPKMDFSHWATEFKETKNKVKSFGEEVSTIFADAMRNIGRSITDALGLGKLFEFTAKEFDDTPFQEMVAAAEKAYDAVKRLRDREFDDQERMLKRREEDEDRQYENEYDLQREAIRNSAASEEEKRTRLEALENQYEEAKLARKREREDAEVAREREQQDKLLKLQADHDAEMDKLRKDEDTARQKLADDEEKRQNSLWTKVKGIFGTAVGEMATLWVTNLIAPIGKEIGGFFGSLFGKAKKGGEEMASGLSGGLGSVGKTLGGLATSIGTVITTLATAVGTGIVTIATAIASAVVALATGIATAATVLAAAAPALLIVGGIALALYAGFSLISSLFGGGGGKQTDVTYWLKFIHENIQIIQNRLSGEYWSATAELVAGKNRMIEQNDEIKAILYNVRDWGASGFRDVCGWLDSIYRALGDLPKAAGGRISTATELVQVHGTPAKPEYIVPHDVMAAALAGGGGGGGEKSVTIHLVQEVNLNGTMLTHDQYARNMLLPEILQALKGGFSKAELLSALGVS